MVYILINSNMEEEKRIRIDPIHEEKSESGRKRKPGRPRLPDVQKKYPKKTRKNIL